MDNMKRFVSMLLCFVMLLGFLPVGVFAAGETTATPIDAAIIFSDLHINSNSSQTKSKQSLVTNVLSAVKKDYPNVSSVNSAGDMYSSNESTMSGNASTITGWIDNVFPTADVNYVWSDHDRGATDIDKKSGLVYEGNYYVYNLSMGDLSSNDRYKAGFAYTQSSSSDREKAGFTATVPQAIEEFEAVVAGLDKTKPLFIVGHQPLFDNRNDNAWAEDWVAAINEVAKTMDVTYFFGHNHKYDLKVNSTGNNDYYFAKGTQMPVPKKSDWGFDYNKGSQNNKDLGYNNVTLNFTHICAGYMNPETTQSYDSSTSRLGTAVAAVIYDDCIEYIAYDKNGVYDGSNAKMELDVSVPRDHAPEEEVPETTAPVEPTVPETSAPVVSDVTLEDPANGVTVTAPGIMAVNVEKIENPAYDTAVYSAYASYDITLEGYTQGEEATVSICLPEGFDAARPVLVLDEGKTIANTVENGVVTFQTTHFSVYDVAQAAEASEGETPDASFNEKTGNLAGGVTYQLATNGVTAGKDYLIANAKTGNVQLMAVEFSNGAEQVKSSAATVNNNQITVTNNNNVAWTFSDVDSPVYITNDKLDSTVQLFMGSGTNGLYSISKTEGMTVTHIEDGQYTIERAKDGKYHLNFNGTNWERKQNTTTYVYLFEYVGATNGTTVNFKMENAANLPLDGGSRNVNYVVTLGDGTAVSSSNISWTSSNSNVVTVNNGVLTPVSEGNATVTAKLTSVNGSNLVTPIELTMNVTVAVKQVASISAGDVLTVERNAKATDVVGKLQVTYDDGTTDEIDLTVGMLQGSFDLKTSGTYENVTVSYGGKTDTVTLNVINKLGNNYPEYPDEGAVKVNKTGTGIDFQSSGIAQVELSASGIPMGRGIDLIIMLDTSSSMDRCVSCGKYTGYYSDKNRACSCTTKVTRVDELRDALKELQNALVASPGVDDIKVAVADFNGMYTSGPVAHSNSSAEELVGESGMTSGGKEQVFTGTKNLTVGAFVNPKDLNIDGYFPKSTSTYATAITHSGTNYDYAFDAIYQLGHAIKTQNEADGNTDRELVVMFMSDGAPNQYNFFRTTGGDGNEDETYRWNKWLQGAFLSSDLTTTNLKSTTNKHYYDLTDWDEDGIINEHRMATAIKGDPNREYKVIRKNQNLENLNASGNDAVTALLTATNETNVYELEGLGAKMYALGFHVKNDGPITVKSVHHVLEQIASTPEMHIEAEEEEGALAKIFNDITTEMLYAADNARFVDKMGKDFDLQMAPLVDLAGEPLVQGDNGSKIEVLEYEIYTRADYLNEKCNEDQIGDRKLDSSGNPISKVVETVRFSYTQDEKTGKYTITGAYSSLIDADGDGTYGWTVKDGVYTYDAGDNILADGSKKGFVKGVIYAKNFLYNTSTAVDAVIEGIEIPTGTDEHNLTTGSSNVLPAESFYWGMGTVKTTQQALRYYVYLTGSMEGTREAGSYPTNESAILYYDNYLGNPARKDTVSPVMPWQEANVSYAFYLVNEKGEVIVNQTSGTTGSFANKIAVTNPVIYKTIPLNSGAAVEAAVVSGDVLPEGYTLFDSTASYTIAIASDSTGSWSISSDNATDTTYVMQYDPNNSAAYSKDKNVNSGAYNYTHTVVWFAVVWKIQALPDTVVVDYGLPVDISVLANDMFGSHGKLAAVGPEKNANLDTFDQKLDANFGTTYTGGTYGDAQANPTTGKVRYTLRKGDGMNMKSHERFAYAVNYSGTTNAGYYYDTVTVIPATTIYYEDDFLTFKRFNNETGAEEGEWTYEGTQMEGATQDEDRPGEYSMTDANNIYGYDGVNKGMSMFSLGRARKVHVDANSYATAEFTFTGTGFDVISMTSNTSGVIAVKVVNAEGKTVKSGVVNTYYGYTSEFHEIVYTYTDGKWVAEDKGVNENAVETAKPENPQEGDTYTELKQIWVATPDEENAIYQVPVMQVEELPYGTYSVTITATYLAPMDKTTADGYDLYVDAIRIYDPANDGAGNSVIEDAYKADGEGWPSYIELRNGLIQADTFDGLVNETGLEMEGLVFIDGDASIGNAQIGDYAGFGPNNEIYLAPGQRVAFLLRTPENIANVHIGLALAVGTEASYTITNVAMQDSADGRVSTGDFYNYKSFTLDTATDMYYDLSAWKNDIIVISNTGTKFENNQNVDGIISITNIKSTYTSNPEDNNASVVLPETGEPVAPASEQSIGTYALRTMSAEPAVTAETTESTEAPKTAAQTVDSRYTYVYVTPGAVDAVVDAMNAGVDPSDPAVPVEPAPPAAPEEPEVPEEPTVPEEPEVFSPKLFHVMLSKPEIKVGQKTLVTVTTSSDVEYVTVNGKKVTAFSRGFNGIRSWKLNVTAEKAGVMDVDVVCYNDADVASETVTKSVTVRHKSALDLFLDLLN